MSAVEPQCPVLPGGEPCESPRWTLEAEAEWMGRVCDDCATGHVRFNLIAARGLRVVDRAVVDEATGHVLAVFPATEGLALARAFLLSAPDEMLRTHRSRWREVAESEAGDGLGVAPCSPVPPSAAEGLRGAQRGAERVSDAEAAEWGRLAGEATEGPWVVDADGSVGAPMVGLVCDEDGHPRLDCSECGTQVCHTSVMPGEPDAAFIAAARTAVPRLLAEREALRAEVERLHGQARVEDVIYLDVCRQLDHERAVRTEIAAERDRARGTAAHLEAENALLSEGVERLSSKIYKLRREAMDDLMALDRVLYAKACELFDNPKEAE